VDADKRWNRAAPLNPDGTPSFGLWLEPGNPSGITADEVAAGV